ncbi:MAG: hypothetical protein HOW73_40390 [Polyangiaceae bacterium]|nr:hypothetical protein [Polyangiaceae bacterium]
MMAPTLLTPQEVYGFAEVAAQFDMKPAVLSWQGGIISRPAQNALLLVTRAPVDGLDYHDRWDGEDLVYGARGQRGNQRLSGVNQLLATNARTNYVFESLGRGQLRFHGTAIAVRYWWDYAPDIDGVERRVLKYLLRLGADRSYAEEDTGEVPIERSEEGARQLKYHLTIERCRALVADAKRYWSARDPLLRCEVCSISFLESYGEIGKGYIEAHHRVPLAALDGATEVMVRDLAPVCANCHRMLHAQDGRTVEDLRQLLARKNAVHYASHK